MGTLLLAALVSSSSTGKAAGTPPAKPSSGPDTTTPRADSPPVSPRTPTTTDGTSSQRHAAMGGRTKVSFAAEPAVTGDAEGGDFGAAGAVRYGAVAAATAAAAAARGGVGAAAGAAAAGLGSLSVDPDEVVRKIKSHATVLPLDEALMEVRGRDWGVKGVKGGVDRGCDPT